MLMIQMRVMTNLCLRLGCVFSTKCNGLMKITIYEEARIKMNYTKLKKLKSPIKYNTEALRISKKNFQDAELLHELFLTTRQKSKICLC